MEISGRSVQPDRGAFIWWQEQPLPVRADKRWRGEASIIYWERWMMSAWITKETHEKTLLEHLTKMWGNMFYQATFILVIMFHSGVWRIYWSKLQMCCFSSKHDAEKTELFYWKRRHRAIVFFWEPDTTFFHIIRPELHPQCVLDFLSSSHRVKPTATSKNRQKSHIFLIKDVFLNPLMKSPKIFF